MHKNTTSVRITNTINTKIEKNELARLLSKLT